ncbi:MAG TPA: Hsp20/alpha crystallin family protein [Candidatus Xenobia bacterium]
MARHKEDDGSKPIEETTPDSRRTRSRKKEFPLQRKGWGYDPMLGLESIRTTMNEMLAELFAKKGTWGADLPWEPTVDLYQEGQELVVEVLLPGVQKKELQIHATRDLLIVKGETHNTRQLPPDRVHTQERRYGQFARSIPLPFEVDPEAIKAELKDGVLLVTLPIHGEETKTYRIDIE